MKSAMWWAGIALVGCSAQQGPELTKETSTSSVTSGTGGGGGAGGATNATSTTTTGVGGGGGGIGGAPTTDPGWESGTRLRARIQSGTDGSQRFVGWHDSTLGIDCAELPSMDGKKRCLPAGAQYTKGYYLDTACSQPVALFSGTACHGDYGTNHEFSVGWCGGYRTEVRSIGALVSNSTLYLLAGTNNCHGPYSQPGSVAHLLGAVVPASTFVELSETIE